MEYADLNFETLKSSLKEKRGELSETHATRLHRAISWLKCAEEQSENPDLQLISLWIAFNACYAVDEGGSESLAEQFAFQRFVSKLVRHDQSQAIYACLWQTYSGPVKALIKNPYVYHGFWLAKRRDIEDESWSEQFDRSSVEALNFLSRQNVEGLLGIVLDRLFVLRNQVIHGGATYQSQINRTQVSDGVKLLGALVPTVLEIMLDTPEEDWGDIYYPVINQ
ncbi:hypothetical protein HF888_12355 [Bermanella marisrubri]|uniref:Uncharacterized protein n=1 Tax=Bermanella marisrubri TaxID=207949 RepID=Q1MZY7_9GAMM|nr:HEPN domain-containing protein [Bermanella marisrubri]EAT11576.1 hypothetical protein RED65_02859 [Oceanobacter sp. RED65] [Bermanella marisrubri]QIZ84962.1 hypothetical protein HF888_12355 [Bermanella marisrubri]